jgi:hypothetical protein
MPLRVVLALHVASHSPFLALPTEADDALVALAD